MEVETDYLLIFALHESIAESPHDDTKRVDLTAKHKVQKELSRSSSVCGGNGLVIFQVGTLLCQ